MSENNKESIHVEGPPWRIVARFATFKEANDKRTEILTETENLQIKVHWMGRLENRFFAVKARVDPAVAVQEETVRKREEKRRRKARLNKKRRKK